MRIKLMMLVSRLLLTAGAYPGDAQVGTLTPKGVLRVKNAPDEPLTANSTLPDLVIVDITADDLDGGKVSVKIKNQGQRNAGRSDVELKITYGSQPPVSVTHSIIPLQPSQTGVVTIDMKQSIVQAQFCVTVDSLKTVAESNENNNKRCGKFGGKP